MSRLGDDVFEMPRDDLGALSAFVDDVRTAASGPMPVPSPALDHVLTRGFSTDKGDLPATAASNANGSAEQTAGLPKWRRSLMKTSKFVAGLSLAAKLALGAGVAVAATATAGFAGVLPGPVQGAVADAVGSVTPFDLPGGSGGSTADGPAAGAPTDPGASTPPPGDGSGPGAGTGSGTGTDTPGTGTPPPGDGTSATPGGSTGGSTGEPQGGTGEPTPPPSTEAPAAPPVTSPGSGPVDEPKVPQTLSISCSSTGDHHVACNWSGADPATFGRYLLLRTSSDGKPGRVLLQSSDIGTTSWDDSLALVPGVTYGYMVLVQGPDGTSVTHSPYVYVTV